MLDDIDIKIIAKLSKDGRISLTDLSTGIELSRVAIANRIEKLIKSELLKVSTLVNLEKLKYQTLLVEMQVSKKEPFRKLITRCPRILHALELMGSYNYAVICASKSKSGLRSFVESVLKKHAQNCRITLAENLGRFAVLKTAASCKNCKLCEEIEDGI